MDKSNLKK